MRWPGRLLPGAQDWSDAGELFVAARDTLAKVSARGEVVGAWHVPGNNESVEVHPDGRSVRVTNPARSTVYRLAPLAAGGDGLPATFDLRLPPYEVRDTGARTFTLLDGDAPIVGAWVSGRYTDAKGRFRHFGPRRSFTTLHHGPFLDALGLATLKIETAAGGQQGSNATLVGVVGAEAFRAAIIARRDAIALGGKPATAEDDVLVQIRDSLLRIEGLLRKEGADAPLQ